MRADREAAWLCYNGVVEISSRPGEIRPETTITGLLREVRQGSTAAFNALFPLVYDELRAIAHSQRRAWHGDLTLDTTALVNEAYLKLVNQKRLSAENRAHFLAVAAKAMRHVLFNYAKSKRRLKRGGGIEHVTFDSHADVAESMKLSEEQTDLLRTLEDALEKLELVDRRQSQIVECRFFGGMSINDIAVALDTSPATVKRHWALARAWLYREMNMQVLPRD